jgi:hypothetical protein
LLHADSLLLLLAGLSDMLRLLGQRVCGHLCVALHIWLILLHAVSLLLLLLLQGGLTCCGCWASARLKPSRRICSVCSY